MAVDRDQVAVPELAQVLRPEHAAGDAAPRVCARDHARRDAQRPHRGGTVRTLELSSDEYMTMRARVCERVKLWWLTRESRQAMPRLA
jgi:hypothetical protein